MGYGREPFALRVTHSLLEHGSDPNSQSSCGKTSVHVAVAWGRVQNLQLLLLHGGDPWQQDDEGKNAFNYGKIKAMRYKCLKLSCEQLLNWNGGMWLRSYTTFC